MRDALTLLDQIIPFSSGKITLAGVRSVLGLVDTEVYLTLFDQIVGRDEAALLRRVAELYAEGTDLAEFALGLEEHVRNLLLGRIKGLDALLECPPETRDQYIAQAARFHELDLLRMAELLSRLADRVSRSALPRFELEAALLKLARMDQAIDIAQFLARGGADGPMAAAPAAASAATGIVRATDSVAPPFPPGISPPPAAAPDDASRFHSHWHDVVHAILSENQTLGSFLTYSTVISATSDTLTLGMTESQKFQFSQATKQENVTWLKNFLQKKYGFAGALAFEMIGASKTSPAQGNAPTPAKTPPLMQKKENINDAIRKEPIMGKILDVFDGSVI